MKVRRPDFDYSDLEPHWGTPEYAQMINGGNLVPAYIEPFIIKVVRRASSLLDPERDAELLADIEILTKQEGQHAKMHASILRMVRDHGYAAAKRHEDDFVSDLDRMYETRSLRFLLAYCEAFEAFGCAVAPAWIDGSFDRAFRDADQRPVELWKWHLAEEYEHRTVVFRLYKRLYGSPAPVAYFYRLAAYFFQMQHIERHSQRLVLYLLRTDRKGMTQSERAQSTRRERRFALLTLRNYWRGMVIPLSPFYDPANARPPKNLDAVLASVEPRA